MVVSRRTVIRQVAAACLFGSAARAGERGQGAPSLVVFAAASLTEALGDVARLWAAQGHPPPSLSFASSAVLARQIEQGAAADLFLSADEAWMDRLARAGRLKQGSRVDLLANALVLIEPASSMAPVRIDSGLSMSAILGPGGRLAVGDPASVPAGMYARQALTTLGLWNQVADRLAPAENVRAALLLVERGEAPAGIVYATDVAAAQGVAVAGIFPERSHPPILYPAARLSDAPDADAFLAFLRSGPALARFRAHGFGIPGG